MKTTIMVSLTMALIAAAPGTLWGQDPPPVRTADASALQADMPPETEMRTDVRLYDPETGAMMKLAELPPEVLLQLGRDFEAQGHKDLAADAYQLVLRSDGGNAEARDAWLRLVGPWELNAFVGLFNDLPEFEARPGSDFFRRDAIVGVRAAYHFPSRFFVQAEVSNAMPFQSAEGLRQNLNGFPILGSVGYAYPVTHDFHLLPALGAGVVVWDPDTTPGSTDFALNYGVGGRLFLSRNHVLRADVRMHHITSALTPTLDHLNLTGDDALWGLEMSVGVSWFPSGS